MGSAASWVTVCNRYITQAVLHSYEEMCASTSNTGYTPEEAPSSELPATELLCWSRLSACWYLGSLGLLCSESIMRAREAASCRPT